MPNNYYNNCYMNNVDNNDNFCKFNCSPYLYLFMPFFSNREFDNNILVNNMQMQLQMNSNNYNYIQYNNIIYNKNNNIDDGISTDKYQESNSSSHLSTTSDGDQTFIGNYNSKNNIESIRANRDIKNLDESIKTGIKAIEDYYNSIESIGDVANLACFFYCDIEPNMDNNFFVKMEVQKLADNYKNIIEGNKTDKNEI